MPITIISTAVIACFLTFLWFSEKRKDEISETVVKSVCIFRGNTKNLDFDIYDKKVSVRNTYYKYRKKSFAKRIKTSFENGLLSAREYDLVLSTIHYIKQCDYVSSLYSIMAMLELSNTNFDFQVFRFCYFMAHGYNAIITENNLTKDECYEKFISVLSSK